MSTVSNGSKYQRLLILDYLYLLLFFIVSQIYMQTQVDKGPFRLYQGSQVPNNVVDQMSISVNIVLENILELILDRA